MFNDGEEELAIIAEVIVVHYNVDGDADIFIGNEQEYVKSKSKLDSSYSGV